MIKAGGEEPIMPSQDVNKNVLFAILKHNMLRAKKKVCFDFLSIPLGK